MVDKADAVKERAQRRGCLVVVLVAVGIAAWQLTFPIREPRRWDGCLGKPLSECKLPVDYFPVNPRCPDWADCLTSPPGASYAWATLATHRGTFWESYAYAVIALDREGRVIKVEIKRMYGAL